ncbi:MAG: helix-turn-helix transcriptional regulator [Bacteroidetes bacterium]|nr:helix-turn-helix transcriptional regulator [Bacteroidota bacterium]
MTLTSLPINIPHRDNNYLFILQKKGKSRLMLDFRKVELKGPSVYFILPGQVHHLLPSDTSPITLSADPAFVQDTYKNILDQHLLMHNPAKIDIQKLKTLSHCITFFSESINHHTSPPCQQHITRGLLDAILGLITQEYAQPLSKNTKKENRSTIITRQFKRLLFDHYKELKKPSDYASLLKISTPYLNEAVKAYSGFTVTYWIQKMLLTEAKRLLYYTDLSIKEIAFGLGYDDHAYFSRLFTQLERLSPLAYRKKHR